jgi:hypothetical protein
MTAISNQFSPHPTFLLLRQIQQPNPNVHYRPAPSHYKPEHPLLHTNTSQIQQSQRATGARNTASSIPEIEKTTMNKNDTTIGDTKTHEETTRASATDLFESDRASLNRGITTGFLRQHFAGTRCLGGVASLLGRVVFLRGVSERKLGYVAAVSRGPKCAQRTEATRSVPTCSALQVSAGSASSRRKPAKQRPALDAGLAVYYFSYIFYLSARARHYKGHFQSHHIEEFMPITNSHNTLEINQ